MSGEKATRPVRLGITGFKEGEITMSDLMTAAVSALQSRVYDQIATSLLKSSAHAQHIYIIKNRTIRYFLTNDVFTNFF